MDGHQVTGIDPSRMYTPKETAQILRVSERTLRRWRSNGVGPTARRYRPSLRYLYAGVDIIAYLREGRAA